MQQMRWCAGRNLVPFLSRAEFCMTQVGIVVPRFRQSHILSTVPYHSLGYKLWPMQALRRQMGGTKRLGNLMFLVREDTAWRA